MTKVTAEYSGEDNYGFEPPAHNGREIREVQHHVAKQAVRKPLPGRAPPKKPATRQSK